MKISKKLMKNRIYDALITVIHPLLLQVFSMPVLFLCFLNLPFTKLHVCFQFPLPCRAINLEQFRESVCSFNFCIHCIVSKSSFPTFFLIKSSNLVINLIGSFGFSYVRYWVVEYSYEKTGDDKMSLVWRQWWQHGGCLKTFLPFVQQPVDL